MHEPNTPPDAARPTGTAALGTSPAEDRRAFEWRSHLLVAALVVAAAVVTTAYVFGPTLYRKGKRYQAGRLARQADAALHDGKPDEAVRLVRGALRFAPQDPAIGRIAARVATRVGSQDSLRLWIAGLEDPGATHEDLASAIEIATHAGRMDLCVRWLAMAEQRFPRDLEFAHLAIRHALRAGDRGRVVALSREVLARVPTDAEAELALGQMLVEQPADTARAEGLRLLWGLAAGSSEGRMGALARLAMLPGLTRSETASLERLAATATNVPVHARLALLDHRLRHDPGARAAVLDEAGRLASADGPVGDVGRVAAWLERRGAPQAALELLPEAHSSTNAVLLATRIDALIALGRTNEVARIGRGNPGPVEAPLLAAAQASLLARAGNRAGAEAAFADAIAAGTKAPATLPAIAAKAEAAGMRAVAIAAYMPLLDSAPSPLDVAREIFRLAAPLEDLRVARATLEKLHAFMPGDEAVATERAWVEAITAGQTLWAFSTFERLHRERPSSAGIRYGLALATWRRGDAAAALGLLDQAPGEWESLEPRCRATYVAVLGANNRREAARHFARLTPVERLRTEERALLDPWL